jgi:hypothetical protein
MNKTLIFLLWVLHLLCLQVKAQVNDDFSDENFTHHPAWLGDDSLFTVNPLLQLQLRATPGTSKDASLATTSLLSINTEFSILAGFRLNPSSQNFSRFYICSDQENLKGSLNGYYLQFGGHTGSTDSIVLFRQQGLSRTAVLWSRPGIVGKNNNLVRIKLIVDSDGLTRLYTDTTGGYNYHLEPVSGYILSNNNTAYTGVFVRFTSSNITNYFFDDIYIGPERFDTEPPRVISTDIPNDTCIILSFNEAVKKEIININNFWINGIKPGSVFFNEFVYNQCTLVTRPLVNGKYQQIEVFGLTDINGNTANDTLFFYFLYMPQANDIIISELMPDPDPPVGLPNAEFVELYNNSPFPINLKGWTISDGSSTAAFTDCWLQPAGFLIVCSAQHGSLFSMYGDVLTVNSLPTLNNSGDNLWIRNSQGALMHFMSYTTAFYKDASKANGGYSLEMLNPKHICKGIDNWQASIAENGGTPGTLNSIFDTIPKNTPPQIIHTSVFNNKVLLIFNERVTFNPTSNITITGSNKTNIQVSSDSVWLFFEPMLQDKQSIEVIINGITDCIGNEFKGTLQLTYFELHEPLQNDVIVTEIMHSPSDATATPVAEYIELYNRSNKAIDLTNCTFTDNSRTVKLPPIKILPDSFVLLCPIQHVAKFNRNNCYGIANWPTLSSNDKVVIKNKNGLLIHSVNYISGWHRDVFKQRKGGYSIEMIDTENPCGGVENWKASNSKNGGTPGYPNSVKGNIKDNTKPVVNFIYPVDSTHLRIDFSETIDSLSVNITDFTSVPHSSIINWHFTTENYQSILLQFSNAIDTHTRQINIKNVKDCSGNAIIQTIKAYGKLLPPDSNALIINEVLFNPLPGGSDFVELYNRSNEFIDLKDLWLSALNEQEEIIASEPLALNGLMLEPKSYMAFTPDVNNVANTYQVPKHAILVQNKLPAMPDKSGHILLHKKDKTNIDRFSYTESMHFATLPTREGVSLERINPYGISAWQSASHAFRFATPGYKNSHYLKLMQSQSFVKISPEVFSVNGINHAQQVAIQINLQGNNHQLKIAIYNSNGALIKNITTFANAGSEQIYYWDGTGNQGQVVTPGIYIIYVEALDLSGKLQSEKTTVVAGY